MSRSFRPRWRHARRNPRHSVVRGVATVGTAVLMFAGSGAAYAYWDIQNNITSLDVNSVLDAYQEAQPTPDEPTEIATPDDPKAGQAINILLMGTDDRSGDNSDVASEGDDTEGMRSDTTLLLHISADRTRVEAVSIPRDLLIPIPSCPLPDGGNTWAQDEAMFNSAFMMGSERSETGSEEAKTYGVACTMLTVREMTGIHVDDFVLVDFAGFKNMVDAIGGVTMTIERDLHDTYTGLDLKAGEQVLNGTQALQLARARHTEGTDGSDIQRIDQQQKLLKAIIADVMNKNLVGDTGQLFSFLGAATASLTMNAELNSLTSLAGLAMSLKGVSMDSVQFVTMPFVYDGPRVRATAQAQDVWAALAADQALATVVPELLATPEATAPAAG